MKQKNIITIIMIILPCLIAVAQIGGETFTDMRDGKTYRMVKIGKMMWMAENLNFQTKNSWCYDDNASNCAKYGRLYTWNAAITACPAGWRLPNTRDWSDLVIAASGQRIEEKVGKNTLYYSWSAAGGKLKSKTGWDICSDHDSDGNFFTVSCNGNGTDDFGFSALPGGCRWEDGSYYEYAGISGFWWTATEYDVSSAHYRFITSNNDKVVEYDFTKRYGYSVRCVREQASVNTTSP